MARAVMSVLDVLGAEIFLLPSLMLITGTVRFFMQVLQLPTLLDQSL